MQKKKPIPVVISWIIIGGLAYVSFTQIYRQYSVSQLRQVPLNLQVAPIQQLQDTSCGEAVITMVYNYAYPQTPIHEQDVIEYATEQGYFIEAVSPYTSPAGMLKIAEHYAEAVSTGAVINSGQGLSLLIKKIRNGEPVIIDVLSNFTDPESEAHFIVVTGISVDPNRGDAIVIHYNDPLTGTYESSDWAGKAGIWNAWKNNRDPGGPGWWLVISHPRSR
jgi:hypothetical protein